MLGSKLGVHVEARCVIGFSTLATFYEVWPYFKDFVFYLIEYGPFPSLREQGDTRLRTNMGVLCTSLHQFLLTIVNAFFFSFLRL